MKNTPTTETLFLRRLFNKTKSSDPQKIYAAASDILSGENISLKLKKKYISNGFDNPDTIRLLFEEFLSKQYDIEVTDSYIFTNEQLRMLDKAASLAKSGNAEEIEKCLRKAFENEYKEEAEFRFIIYGFNNEKSLKKMITLYLEDKAFEKNFNGIKALLSN